MRTQLAANRAQLFRDLSMPFYGFNKPEAKLSDGLRDSFFWRG